MRSLFLLLLLLNILFLAWARWIAPPPALPGRATRSSQDSSSIRLVEELRPAEPLVTDANVADRQPETPTSEPADSAGQTTSIAGLEPVSCVSAGPYLDSAAAESAAARLSQLGFESRLRVASEDLLIGSWVRVSNIPTADDAASTRDAMREAGITEAYIVSDGSPGNTVSLGVFSDARRAGEVVALARSAGFAAQVSDRYRTAQVFWLDMDRVANAGLPDIEDLRGPGITWASFELRACPGPAIVGDAVR